MSTLPLLQTLNAHSLSVRDILLLITLPAVQSELAVSLGVTKGAVSRQIDLLEDQGLVLRKTGLRDRRQKRVELTEAGAAMLADAELKIATALEAGKQNLLPAE